MNSFEKSQSIHALHRLLPSELDEMERMLSTNSGVSAVVELFRKYLMQLQKPEPVELDDVTRIALQLNSVGLWKKVSPEAFLKDIRSVVDKDVLMELRDTLKVEPTVDDAHRNKAQRPAVVGGQWVRPANVTLKQLAASLAEENELSKKQAEAILGGLVGKIVKHLKKGERIRIGGLGILQVRKGAARMGRNPATGQLIKFKARKKVAFRASSELKKELL